MEQINEAAKIIEAYLISITYEYIITFFHTLVTLPLIVVLI